MSSEPFVPTPSELIEAKLALAAIADGDIVYDLGSGDGRVLIECARRTGARCVGIELNRSLAEASRKNVAEAGLSERIEIRTESLTETPLEEADFLILYLTRGTLGPLSIRLEEELKAGARIVTHEFDLPGWTEVKRIEARSETGLPIECFLYQQA